ncbi:beta-carotene 3-hydroxylase 1, chloroplastic-like isoform X3 [Cucurbita maxima]|uniref:beta-carotene 3-hydroxylase n=1 Tax=Cucurbita maxima TaxID=3661 RepID=A0A6J1I2U2_CUCMA|nr:beta-carotene 3-hydroxylase 1, chloroplastic-like isoform X3 [Cucurbita maxima]
MATGISAVATAAPYRRIIQRPAKAPAPANRVPWRCFAKQSTRRLSTVKKKCGVSEVEMVRDLKVIVEEKMGRKKAERDAYLVAAIVSSFGITSMAAIAVYYRFSWQLEGGDFPVLEMFGTFALSVGAAVGMEFWARWAHKQLWHDALWNMHKGLGITVFGMAYMFVHDGLVHRRFPVGPIAAVPYLRRVAAAHHIHHTDKFDGVPYGLFLGPKELEDVDGEEELQNEIKKRSKVYRN